MDKCTARALLSERNKKHTRQRIIVLDAIIASDAPFSASDLNEELCRDMDPATIYRNLEMLCDEGIIRQVMNENERQYYELACKHNPEHPHFYCSSCGRIYCLKNTKKFSVKGEPGGSFIVQQTMLQFRGICPRCR